jgi:hypothetical protein
MDDDTKMKLVWDWCKHTASLSAGAILLGATFREKFACGGPEWLVKLSFVGFGAALCGTLMVQADFFRERKSRVLGFGGTLVAAVGFATGIFSVIAYALLSKLR